MADDPAASDHAAAKPRARDVTPNPLVGVTPSLDKAVFRWSVGTRPLPADQWLVIDEHRHSDLREKDRLLAEQHEDVVAVTPAGLEASGELLELVCDHLREYHPDQYHVSAQSVTDRDSQRTVDLPGLHPVDAAGRLVAEDFLVLMPAEDQWVLAAASVCFTSRWRLRDKLGQNLIGIHEPVPGYQPGLAAAVDKVFERITTHALLTRSNWTLLDTPELHLPASAAQPVGAPRADPAALPWLRTERQTLRRLPRTGAVVFTILTRVSPTSDLPPETAAKLRRLLATVPPEIATYKGW